MADSVQGLTRVRHFPGFRFAKDEEDPIQQWNALGSLSSVSGKDPLQAAIGALEAAAVAHGADHYRQFLTDLRQSFPTLDHTNQSLA